MPHTPNFSMPLLFAAQAQKEITHNEALVLVDALLGGCVEAVATDPAALDPAAGEAWIIGTVPVGEWSGRPAQIAVFTPGGWRFAPGIIGMRLYARGEGVVRTFDGSNWLAPAAIANPGGGSTVDVEARSALAALLSVLRASGMVAAT